MTKITTTDYTDFVLHNYHTTFQPPMAYIALGLAGESGEAVDAVKKILRGDKQAQIDGPGKVILELGDVLYYTTRLAHEFGVTLDQLMLVNRTKLEHRHKHGKSKENDEVALNVLKEQI